MRTGVPKPPIAEIRLMPEDADEEILQLGQMHRDAKLVVDMLKQLPFKPDDYRGTLRVIAGAAERIRGTCARLIDDGPIQPKGRQK